MLKSLYSLAECVISWSFFRYMNYIKTFLLHMVNFWRKLFIIKQLCLLLKIMTTETIQMDLIKSWHSPVKNTVLPPLTSMSVWSLLHKDHSDLLILRSGDWDEIPELSLYSAVAVGLAWPCVLHRCHVGMSKSVIHAKFPVLL